MGTVNHSLDKTVKLAEHSRTTRAKMKKEWRYISTSLYAFILCSTTTLLLSKIRYCVHKRRPLHLILSQLNPVSSHILLLSCYYLSSHLYLHTWIIHIIYKCSRMCCNANPEKIKLNGIFYFIYLFLYCLLSSHQLHASFSAKWKITESWTLKHKARNRPKGIHRNRIRET